MGSAGLVVCHVRDGDAMSQASIYGIDKRHIERVKSMSCSVCGQSGPSDFHHILEGRTPGRKSPAWTGIPLCKDCHQGAENGIHGRRAMWKVMRRTELLCLNDTLRWLYGRMAA